MFAIYGIINNVFQNKIGEPFANHYDEKLIATFDEEKHALSYVNRARLKKVIKKGFSSRKPFKSKSLLCGCEDADVRVFDIPHNPLLF